MECPPANTLVELSQGRIGPPRLSALEEHLDRCDGCRAALVELLKSAPAPARVMETQPLEGSGFEAPEQSSEDLTRVGRYVIQRVLGRGGMGIVFQAYDPELDRKVAIKLLRRDRSLGEEEGQRSQRLLREAHAMAKLSHPNVVPVFDAGSFEGRIFIAMELVEGSTLSHWLRERQRSADEVVEVFVRAGRGLAAAHRAGLVHRDFKPDNVLVGVEGNVRVTDFGLARSVSAPALEPFAARKDLALGPRGGNPTQTGLLVGTPAYLPPELAAGATPDARADQFSFCVSLFEALYGHRPFEGDTLDELLASVRAGPPRKL